MPFKSEKQRRYLWANEPEIARDWTDTYGSGIAKALGGRIPFYAGNVVATNIDNPTTKFNIQEMGDYGILNGAGFRAQDIEGKPPTKQNIIDYYKGTYKPTASLNNLVDNRYVDSGMIGTDARYVNDNPFMAANWSELDDAEAQNIDAQRQMELARLAGMEQYPTEENEEGFNLLEKYNQAKKWIGPIYQAYKGNMAGALMGSALGPFGLLAGAFAGGQRTPRDPGYGRGLSGGVSFLGSRYDKQHGTGAYKQKQIQDWHKKYGHMQYKTKKMQEKQAFMKRRADQIAQEKAAAFKTKIDDAYRDHPGGGQSPSGGGGRYDGASSRAEWSRDPTGYSGSHAEGGLASLWRR